MNQTSRQKLTAPIRRVRFVYVAMFFCFWAVVIAVRLTWLQVVQHSEWVERAKQQQQRTFEVAPHRGVLYDRNMRALAMTVLVDSIYAVPSELGDNKADDAALLAKIVHVDPLDGFTREKDIDARFNASRHFAWVARKVTPDIANRVRQLNLKGIYFYKEFKRFYPSGDLAAHVLGYVGTDDTGLGGLEAKFDDELHGEPGHELTAIDAKRHVLGSDESDPIPGENLELTIDSNIQYMAERALDAQMAKVKAAHGTIVVQDPNTGQILALAVSPRFNPNDPLHVDPQDLTDLAVSDVYEPGSTFKLVTYSAALDAAGVKPTDTVDTQGGEMTMYGRTLHDDAEDRAHHYGVVTIEKALEISSDVGAAKMALKIGPDTFYKYIKAFGFGDRSGIELPSETRGLLRPPRKWGSTSILSIAIGQEIAVTPVQLVTMVSTIANGGLYLPPHVLLQSTDDQGGGAHMVADAFHPEDGPPAKLPDGAHRVISEKTSAEMREMMQGVVLDGTGKPAQLNGYSSAGKTGTAQKVDPITHTYSHTNVVASFAGFAPVNHPAISIAVVIDNPTVGSRFGTAVSAPVFREVAQEVLEYLGVPHDQPLKTQQQMLAVQNSAEPDDEPDQQIGDLNAVYDEVNSLPSDDPLRQPQTAAAMEENRAADAEYEKAEKQKPQASGLDELPDKVAEAFHKNGDTSSTMGDGAGARVEGPVIRPQVQARGNGAVVIDAGKRVAVPDFHGSDLRSVVEKAGNLGLRVQTLGSGLAQDQAPAAGTMVPVGTEIVVRFVR
ncbi:MAG: penicillin-binding protein [Acidobacteriaceae bacterium]